MAEPLFEDAYTYGVGPRSYDVGPGGRFLMIKEETAPPAGAVRALLAAIPCSR